jgi:nucleotide-binding universal stress UspA family protein
MTAVDLSAASAAYAATSAFELWRQNRARLAQSAEQHAQFFRDHAIEASVVVADCGPKQLLVQQADQWRADCIFVGARGLSRLERLLLGSVSSAVAARARCAVEVVR